MRSREGEGEAILAGVAAPFAKGEALCVPAGSLHNVRNSGEETMRLFTIYSPPQHAAGTVEKLKPEAVGGGRSRAAVA